MYVLFLIEIYELFSEFSGFFLMARLGLIIYENILKCDKCATEYIEIQKSFSLWCIIVNFLSLEGLLNLPLPKAGFRDF